MSKPALLASTVSFAHLNGLVPTAEPPASPAPRADDGEEGDDEEMRRQKAEKKARRKAKAKKRDDDDGGEDDPDPDDDDYDDDEENDMKGVTGRARARERARIARIMSHPAAGKNAALALGLALRTNMTAGAVIATLADSVSVLPAARRNSLEQRMAASVQPAPPATGSASGLRPADRALALVNTLRGSK